MFRGLVFNVGFDCLDSAHQTVLARLESYRVMIFVVDWLGQISTGGEPLGRANRAEEP
jgi:hypothetical protein